ncbi:threonine/serine exporter family protein [Phocaeicola vulgatus]|uniref:threonine/serine exporter family protein n=2 Tax=Bacteroidales TaxID=171549 RepID=UPI003A8053C7
MKTQQELCDILGFIAEYATYQLGSGVHTSRVIRNAQRIGEALGVDVQLSSFQKSTILTVLDTVSGESATRVVAIPSLPISFERNSDLSALSWDALDEGLSLDEIRSRYRTLVDKPRMDPIFTLVVVGLANASFCKLFGGDWTAVGIVFTATLVGFAVKQRMQAHAVNHFLVFACSAFVASLCATAALRFDCTAEIALATSPLFLVPGVPLINGVIDIMEGHVLMGGSLWLGRGVRCPMTCLYIPALLPMVPGIYAYKTVFSLIMFLQSLDRADEGMRYMQQFFLNATVSLSVIALLAAGATLPIFIFKRRAFSMTRRTRKNS